ncbi:hypothetical protein B0H21DRAFT_709530 [Amylocystis lapponica]|nr:hypothetical protein B0H21DRAFT_709530 [Amylocystis lapponica]
MSPCPSPKPPPDTAQGGSNMESSVAEQRATAVAKLKRAASLPRMKDGRRPPMHNEAVSEGERVLNGDGRDEESAQESDGKEVHSPEAEMPLVEPQADEVEAEAGVEPEAAPPETPAAAETTPARAKRRSRSRTRSRGSKDLKKAAAKQSPHLSSASHTNDSSADEYYMSAPGEDPPPSPPVMAPIPSPFVGFPAPRLLASPLFYPGTTPSTPLPSLDDIQKGIGLYRSNSAGPARAMAMQKLTGGKEPMDFTFISRSGSPTVQGGARLGRNNTVAGGERMEARRFMLHRLGNRIKEADGDQTSGGEEIVAPSPPPKRRRRRSKRNSSRASTVVDDRDEREPPSTSPNTPIVPPSPLPFSNVSEPPRPPSSTSRIANGDAGRASPYVKTNGDIQFRYETPLGHRGVVVEDEDDLPERQSSPRLPLPLPSTPARGHAHLSGGRMPHSSDAPSSTSTDSVPGGVALPVFLSRKSGYRLDAFPATPFATPLKERPDPEDEEEQPDFPEARSGSRLRYMRESDISWMADPVPEQTIPLHDEDEDEEDDEEVLEPEPEVEENDADHQSTHSFDEPSSPKGLLEDFETSSPELSPSQLPPSPPSPPVLSIAVVNDPPAGSQRSPSSYPMRLSVATPNPPDRSPSSTDFPEWDENRATITDSTIKREASTSTWERVKNTFTRSNSSNGRRSRANSIGLRDRRNNTDSSSAGIDPRYYDSKLQPFPGIEMLKDKRNRAMPASTSNPDVTSPNGLGVETVPSSSSSSTATRLPPNRERKLSHQASDTRLLPKFQNLNSPQLITSVSSSASQVDYFSLPMNREGVKKWLSAKKIFSSQSSTPTTPTAPIPPPVDTRPHMSDKKPSIPDFLGGRKENGLVTEWEGIDDEKTRTPTNSTSGARFGQTHREEKLIEVLMGTDVHASHDSTPETIQSPRMEVNMVARTNGVTSPSSFSAMSFPSPPDPPSSITPDPQSSLDEFPTPSTSDSFSSSSLRHSPDPHIDRPPAGGAMLERLEEALGRSSKVSFGTATDELTRKLVLCSPVLQVANAITVKDRFLFLFSDILIIAKPVVQDQDTLLDTAKPNPSDRKFTIKSVVRLPELRFISDRDGSHVKTSTYSNAMRHPVIRTFVHQFAKDPDHAITTLLGKTNIKDDAGAIGQLIFRTTDLDRARLGEYLSLRTSKVVLKAYVDSFGFSGLRIDKALRAFLQSIHIPPKSVGYSNALEYLLDVFASRWYEANAGIAYDKDLAVRLVRAIVQLNEVMHGGIAQEPSVTGYPKRNVLVRDFIEACRRLDPRSLIPDEQLDKIYTSIRREKLFQARSSSSQSTYPDVPIMIKRPLPTRLTHREQSDPIILRIPQPDSQLSIQLFGEDLEFDPSTLSFAKSAEASFRVTGKTLGSKTIIMLRSGANALAYAGLPFSSTVKVERMFMRNTFQVAFVNHCGVKRKYMFSVDDPLVRHQWAVAIKRQIDLSLLHSTNPIGQSITETQSVCESLAFKILQDTLISPDEADSYPEPPLSPIDQTLARLNGSHPSRHVPNGSTSSARNGNTSPSPVPGSRRQLNGSKLHTRSKSRSQVYQEPDYHSAFPEEPSHSQSDDVHSDGKLWRGRDLELVCEQNSMIGRVLTYLMGGERTDHEHMPTEVNGGVS